jgi:hypothetical protein
MTGTMRRFRGQSADRRAGAAGPARLRTGRVQGSRAARWFVLSVLLGLVLLIVLAPRAQAERAIDIPGIDVCKPSAPVADAPNTGAIAAASERPRTNQEELTPENVWTNGSFSGMYSTPYDLGCGADPTTYARQLQANADAEVTNTLLGVSYTFTALTDAVDRRAWNPAWIKTFLGEFAARAVEVINLQVLVPFLGAGLAASVLFMLWKFRYGNIAGAAKGVAWVLVVLSISAFLISGPTWAASTAQSTGSGLVSVLNHGPNASDAATNRTVNAVHYQAWLRRTFGTDSSAVATKYGPALLKSLRVTWAEHDRVKDDPAQLAALRKAKAADFTEIAKRVKAEDPGAYLWMTRAKDGSGIAFTELLYSLSANFFRLAVDFLLILAVVLLVALAAAWLLTAPITVTPPGQALGITMLNVSARAFGYVLIAAAGSWMFGVYLQACLQPGMSTWWSILLLLVGTVIAWTLIRPDRKALSLVTGGQVHGTGKLAKILTGLAFSLLTARIAGQVAGKVAARQRAGDEPEIDITPEQTPPPPPIPTIPTVHAYVYTPMPEDRGLDSEEVVEGEVVYDSKDAAAVGPGAIYQRPVGSEPSIPTPPRAGSVGEVEIYRRPDSNTDAANADHDADDVDDADSDARERQ